MNLKKAFITMAFCLGLVAVSSAQTKKTERKEPPTYTELLKELDANEDGKLAKLELKGPLKDDFEKIDKNEDGFISEIEFKTAPKPEARGQRKSS